MRRFLRLILISGFLFMLVFGGGIWAGVELRRQLDKPLSIASHIHWRVIGFYNSMFRAGSSESTKVFTNRVRLKVDTFFLPLDVAGKAGGITVVGGTSVVVLDRQGTMFLVTDGMAEPLDVATPDNNMAALRRQFDDGRFGEARIDYEWFRYNDVLHVSDSTGDWLILSYSHWNPEAFCQTSRLARLQLPAGSAPRDWRATAQDWELVKETAPCLPPRETGEALAGLEAGGRLVSLDPGRVAWSSGAYERDDAETAPYTQALSQRLDSDYGKVLEVTLETGDTRILARGLRNPQGLTMDRNGQLWVTDHGMRGGDELNRVVEGANFGWPAVTYGTHYNTRPAVNSERHGGHAGYDLPTAVFVPSVAPGSALAVSDFNYAWEGDILIGGFNGNLYRVHNGERDGMVIEEIPMGDIRLRDMDRLADGRIVIWTDDRRIIYLTNDTRQTPADVLLSRISALEDTALRASLDSMSETCLRCHGLAEGEILAGPSLHGICGAEPGSADYDGYSGALAAVPAPWSTESLARFIENPEAVAPGNSMAWSGASPRASQAMAELLCALQSNQGAG
ncbi:MAG: PQQ-dependent sugar dehydrogenase [Pseudomonadota bacterium]